MAVVLCFQLYNAAERKFIAGDAKFFKNFSAGSTERPDRIGGPGALWGLQVQAGDELPGHPGSPPRVADLPLHGLGVEDLPVHLHVVQAGQMVDEG